MDTSPSTRDKILHAAARLFGTYGCAGVSMSAIAKDVGISKAALYHFFENKIDIYCAAFESILSRATTIFHDAANAPEQKTFALVLQDIIALGLEEGSILVRTDMTCDQKQMGALHERTLAMLELFMQSVHAFLATYGVKEPQKAMKVLLSALKQYVRSCAANHQQMTPKEYTEYLETLFVSNTSS